MIYLLIVFDFIVHYIWRRLFHLWPGEGDAGLSGPVFADYTHQSRTWGCRGGRDGTRVSCDSTLAAWRVSDDAQKSANK